MLAHARVVATQVPHDQVHVGFARGTPSLHEAVLVMMPANAPPTTVTVVPFMTSAGYYAAQILPRTLREAAGATALRFVMTSPIGTHRRVTEVLHRRALRQAVRAGWALHETTVLLVGHGTPRHRASRDATTAHARALQSRGWLAVASAFIDDEPTIPHVLAQCATACVIVLPFLIGGAAHAAVDIPEAIGLSPDSTDHARRAQIGPRQVILDEPLGVDAALADIAADRAVRAWPRAIRRVRTATAPRVGSVALVGAGPGAPDLITLRGRQLLRRADVILYDRLIGADLLALARPEARLIDVGKWPETPQDVQEEINTTMIAAARDGFRVVRLKGGDPMVFGRGSEELAACREAAVPVQLVPGVSSALAAPAVAGIPVTARHISRSFAVVTAATSTDVDSSNTQLSDVAGADTIVVLMGHARLGAVCDRLQQCGRHADTPVACIENATLATERVVRGTLATIASLADAARLVAPMVIVIGPTAHWEGGTGVA